MSVKAVVLLDGEPGEVIELRGMGDAWGFARGVRTGWNVPNLSRAKIYFRDEAGLFHDADDEPISPATMERLVRIFYFS